MAEEDINMKNLDEASDTANNGQESPDLLFNELLEVMSALQLNPFDYSLHERNITLCQKLGTDALDELNQARMLMIEYFSVKESFFFDWISDLSRFQESSYNLNLVQSVLNVYEQASSHGFFPKIEASKLNYVINLYYHALGIQRPIGDLMNLIEESTEELTSNAGCNSECIERIQEQLDLEKFITEEKIRSVAIDVIDKIGYHLLESSEIWNAWALYEFDMLKRHWNEQRFGEFKALLQSRLRIPHTDSAKTFQTYSTLITKHENDNYEEELVAVNSIYSPARKMMDDREIHESLLKKLGFSEEGYLKYLAWETSRKPFNFDLAFTLFERAILDHPSSPELWLEFLRFLAHHRDQTATLNSVAKRATRTVPWSGDVWASTIRTLERSSQSVETVEDFCARAIQSKFLEHDVEAVVAFTIGRADFHRRRLDAYIAAGGAENTEQVAELVGMVSKALLHGIDVLKKAFAKSGDPSCRLEKYLSVIYERQNRQEDAAKVWQKATKQYREVYSSWLSAAEFEVRRGDLIRARDYYKKAANIKLDYPECLLQAWLSFEHHFGNLEDIEYAISKVNNIMKGIHARRKREAEQQLSAFPSVPTLITDDKTDVAIGLDNSSAEACAPELDHNNRKRKIDAVTKSQCYPDGDKKAKMDLTAQDANGSVQELKRDRENSTVLVGGLNPDITEAKISQLFRDCGKIREITIHRLDEKDVVATVEFADRNSVLPAQTKDKKKLDGNEVEVTLAWRSTLYLTNFPEDANDLWIRNKFSPYGKIVDVRWPSKRFKSTRRFCYVQYTSPESAQAALVLHEQEVAPQQKLSVLISNPTRKQARSDSRANEREIYITCLSKFVQGSDLRKLFAPFGEIKGVRLILDEAGHSKGFAFVEFESELSAKAALSLNNSELKKRRIGVTISSANGLALARKNNTFNHETKLSTVTDHLSRSVRVSNIAEGTQEALIQQAFEPFGKVLKTITYAEKNEAVVEFELARDAGNVFLNPNPILINGRQVELSVPSTAVKINTSASTSFSPLLPRSAMRGKKSRIGLGSGARATPKAEELSTQNHVKKGDLVDESSSKANRPASTATAMPKDQDYFRKMLA
ncbi:hypothetical protein O181_003430 [Austropuccinia psidii MF-1]|uniref:U4/U6 snRNA-associated-splicing factor PRP24 n=1 Tax=Austropuccinia psidii MF-1 TaxID=1389203 RepID=A0A9Q3BEF5_9BASI|nr:hypothetical protein [Austropuccinia psidii MF-1]